jgi:hypothetical protein
MAIAYTNGLNTKEAKFTRNIIAGMNKSESAKMAGYAPRSAGVSASRLLRKDKIIRALDRAGLSDMAIATMLKTHATNGMGIKATSDTSLKAIQLAMTARGHLDNSDKDSNNNTINNTYINELKVMSINELELKLQQLQQETNK